MNACLAIIAHEGARETIELFQPKWKTLGIPIYGFVPLGQSWPGDPVQCFVQGENARTGTDVYGRFISACKSLLLTTDHDLFVIAEYDTVNLTPYLPAIDFGCVNTFIVSMVDWHEPDAVTPMLSPWIVTRPMLAAMLEACRMFRREYPQGEGFIKGLLDRWIGAALIAASVPTDHCYDMLSYPWREDYREHIAKYKCTWIHGWKTKQQFGDLWTE